MYEIKRDKLRPSRSPRKLYPWDEMKPGDCIEVEADKVGSARSSLYSYLNRNGLRDKYRAVSRKLGNGFTQIGFTEEE